VPRPSRDPDSESWEHQIWRDSTSEDGTIP
jgi:hypothetical protein